MNITDFLLARIAEDEAECQDMLKRMSDAKDWDHAYAERVLAECAAKRAVVGIHGIGADPCDAHDASCQSIPCETLEALAAVYRDHPDWRQEWA